MPLFLEVMTFFDKDLPKLEAAKRKPALVCAAAKEFSQEQYHADVLKVEFPIDASYCSGLQTEATEVSSTIVCVPYIKFVRLLFCVRFLLLCQVAYTREQAMAHFQELDSTATKPYIFLSAG